MPFYVCNIIGTDMEEDPYRPAIAGIGPSFDDFTDTVLLSNPDGTPSNSWCIASSPAVLSGSGINILAPQANKAALDAALALRGEVINENAPEYILALRRIS